MAALALATAACGGTGAESSPTRTVLVDYNHDEFASAFLTYFPKDVRVHPGDRVSFRQEWTGEPHSVTMGTLVDDAMGVVVPLMEKYPEPDAQPSPEDEAAFEAAFKDLPWMIGDNSQVQQNGAQPCYLDEGVPPADPNTPCADEQQTQPRFNGRQSFYNSGFIPYQGPQGNRFEVPLATDIDPGTYWYYCNLHGPGMAGTITVVPSNVAIPSQDEVARQAREEIEAMAAPLVVAHREARERDELELNGERYRRPLAGWASPQANVHAFLSEFYPEPLEVRVGEKVTWSFVGLHTVSFNVPRYFAPFTVDEDGTVRLTPEAVEPVNSPPLPKEPEAHPEAEHSGPEAPTEPPPPPSIDAGEWDGVGFKSSGGLWEGLYSLTFTRPGTYNYACLLHPRMVGKVIVR